MIKHLVTFIFVIAFVNKANSAELLVKTGTITYGGYSAVSDDLSTIYGGIAGNACTGGGVSTCNSCTDAAGTVNACNQSSVYSSLKFSVSFKVTKTVTGIAKLFIESTSSGVYDSVVSLGSATYTQDSTVVTLETTWSEICSRAGLSGSCTGTSALVAFRGIRYGVDSDNSGEVEESERKSATIKLHFIPDAASGVSQAYCSSTGSGAGVCNVAFLAGDQKAFIDSAIYSGDDLTSTSTGGTISWESIAIFPVPVSSGGEAAAYSSFGNGVASPIFKTINTSDGSIPDSMVTGGLSNYQEYCMVYGAKNKAQNIYKFVTTGVDTSKSCITPSEVVGLLDDKHCFISTAAFGSDSAPEVEVFRKFRNKFLLTNRAGRLFVKLYYALSPPIADFISKSDLLKMLTRMMLYPLYIFAYTSLNLGFLISLLFSIIVLLSLVKFYKIHRTKKIMMVVFLMLLSLNAKAEIIPDEIKISHPQAQEGLVRIKKDGTYIYDTERKLKSESSRISLGQAYHPDITISIEQRDTSGNPTGTFNEYNFQDFYNEDSGFILGYDYEWFPFINKGRLGLQAGVSVMTVTGNGRLVATPNPASVESYTFATVPITLGGVYRMEWKDKQLFAPFISGGGTLVALLEKREDKSLPNFSGGIGFYGAGGVLLNLGSFDSDGSFQLESEYGISNMWLSIEFRMIEVSTEAFSFSNKYVNAGLSFDF